MTSDRTAACGQVVDLLVHYLEHRLPADEAAELERHLSTCDACVAQVNTYRSTIALLASLRDHDLPPELRNRVTAFLQK